MDTAERLLREALGLLEATTSRYVGLVEVRDLRARIDTYLSSIESEESAALAECQTGTDPATMLRRDDRGLYDPPTPTVQSETPEEPLAIAAYRQCVPTSDLRKTADYIDLLRSLLAQREETHQMQIAAISIASTANTRESWEKNKLDRTNLYWTVAYGDVLHAISREINERERAERAEKRLKDEHSKQ